MRTGPRNIYLHLPPGILGVEAFGEPKEVVFNYPPSQVVNPREEVLFELLIPVESNNGELG